MRADGAEPVLLDLETAGPDQVAAAIDGARPARRFWTIIFPLLSPTIFFLIVVNIVYAFFETFGIIDTMTRGGPANATQTLVYKVYEDGLLGGQGVEPGVAVARVRRAHGVSQAGSAARARRSFARQRPRVGPMLPWGIPRERDSSA